MAHRLAKPGHASSVVQQGCCLLVNQFLLTNQKPAFNNCKNVLAQWLATPLTKLRAQAFPPTNGANLAERQRLEQCPKISDEKYPSLRQLSVILLTFFRPLEISKPKYCHMQTFRPCQVVILWNKQFVYWDNKDHCQAVDILRGILILLDKTEILNSSIGFATL